MKQNIGIVICSRLGSSRIPNKVFKLINGKPLIEHLLTRLKKTGLKIFIAVPEFEYEFYCHLEKHYPVKVYASKHADDPLHRMKDCAVENKLDAAIRISHDKIFVSEADINEAIQFFNKRNADYLYSSKFVDGCGFEIISTSALIKASEKYSKIEYIGYAVRTVTDKCYDFYHPLMAKSNARLLIDYPDDLNFFEVIFSQLGNNCTLSEVIRYTTENPDIKKINQLPQLTIYTCAYNAADWIDKCMESVSMQTGFKDFEYIIVDDCSQDKTTERIAKFALRYSNVRWVRNTMNLGLSASSNVALKMARGKYIIRLDADDFFVATGAMRQMINEIEQQRKEVIYPANYFGSYNIIQQPDQMHHVGGAIFERKAINHLQFTDGLEGHDSLDIFLRAKAQLKIGYTRNPMFFYTQHDKSMSKNNIEKREKIKSDLMAKYGAMDDEDFELQVDDNLDGIL